MDIVDEMIGQERRRGMRSEDGGVRTEEGENGMRQMTVAALSTARAPYRTSKGQGLSLVLRPSSETRDEKTRDLSGDGRRSMWVECRECEYRERVPSMNRSELIRAVDSGEVRCRRCGGRMVEG